MGRDRSLDEFVNVSGADEESDEDVTVSGDDVTVSDGVVDQPVEGSEGRGDGTEDDGERGATDVGASDLGGEGEAEGESIGPDAVDPAVATYRFDPAGSTCEACGAGVRRRWYDDGAFVCRDCKSWDRDAERATPP